MAKTTATYFKDTTGSTLKSTGTTKTPNTVSTLASSLANMLKNNSSLKNTAANALTNKLSESATNPLYPDTTTTTTTTPTTTATYDTSAYDALYNEYAAQQQALAEKQKAATTEEYNNQLKSAYITRMQNQKTLDENLALAGIRGGATETANLKLLSNYENSRNTLNADKVKALQAIDDSLAQNLLSYKQEIDMAKLAYLEQRDSEARQLEQSQLEYERNKQDTLDAEQRANAREDEVYARERADALADAEKATAAEKAAAAEAEAKAAAAEKAAAQSDYWTAKYSTWYKISNLNKAYKNATSTEEKTIIKARIGYLQAQKKGY